MSVAAKVAGFGLHDLLRSRVVLAYGAALLLLTEGLFRFAGDGPRALASLLNVVLLLVPLVCVVYGTLHFGHSREFIELLLAQPVGRPALFTGLYLGLAAPLGAAFALGVGLPALWHGGGAAPGALVLLLAAGLVLTLIFTALAFLAGVAFEDRAKGLGVALLAWFAATVLYDGLLLLVVALFGDWPLEVPLLALTFLNPVDLARVLLLLAFDSSALMGYTGAVFQRTLGSLAGQGAAALALVVWAALPFLLGRRGFGRKDF